MKLKPPQAAALLLALTVLACQFLPGSSGSGSGALFEDDFADNGEGWDETSSDNAAVGYVDGEYSIQVFPTGWFAWANPEGANLSVSNVHIEVSARNAGAATEPGFGVMCAYGDGDNTYYMGVSVDGYYIIAKTVAGEDTILSDEDSWITSDAIPLNAASYQLGADCGNGSVSLQVNGSTLATVSDSTFTEGTVGLFVQTFAEPNAEVRFDNYVVTAQ
jgi:hypothetical protein